MKKKRKANKHIICQKMSVREKNKARTIGEQLGQDCYSTLNDKRKLNC